MNLATFCQAAQVLTNGCVVLHVSIGLSLEILASNKQPSLFQVRGQKVL
jgi:hypothetical protein